MVFELLKAAFCFAQSPIHAQRAFPRVFSLALVPICSQPQGAGHPNGHLPGFGNEDAPATGAVSLP